MLLAQVEAFLEVVRLGNVSRAAEALYVSQPTLTARLKNLEAELGELLFLRTGRGLRLTEAGRAFLPHAERAVRALREGETAVAELQRGEAGLLVVGAAPAVSTYVLPALLRRFLAEAPGVRLAVRTGHSEEVLDMVLADDVHVGLVRALHHPEVESIPVYEDHLVLVVPPGHHFTGGGGIRIEDLGAEPLILFDRTSSYHELTSALFREAGVLPRSVMELDNIEAAKKMVAAGLGVALLPHIAVTAEVASGSLAEVEVVGASPVHRQIVAIRRRDGTAASATPVRLFLATVREAARARNDPL
jgi:DNA-binding transcriptional LysR family regulator